MNRASLVSRVLDSLELDQGKGGYASRRGELNLCDRSKRESQSLISERTGPHFRIKEREVVGK